MAQHKILILTNRVPYPLKDGGNLAMHAMIEGYHKAGWEVYLLAMNTTRHHVSAQQLSRLYPHLKGFDTVDIDNRLKPLDIIKNLLFSKLPNHAQRFLHQSFAAKLEAVLASFRPDIVQVESVYLTTYLPAIRQHSQALAILRMHNVEYQIWHRLLKGTKHWYKQIFLRELIKRVKRFEELAWKQYDLLLPITDSDAAKVKRTHIHARQLVAPFSIDVAAADKQHANYEEWVGYHIGAMDWRPNAEAISWFLKHVWPKLHHQVPQFSFYYAGRHMPDSFKKLKKEGAYCMGEVPDAAEFIKDKKILIVPLRSGGGIRVKIMEGMAAGKVVISTPTGMQGIDAEPGVHYLAANKKDEFIQAVKWCLDNKVEAEKIANNASQLINEHYNEQTTMQRVITKIDDMIAHRG